LPSDRSANQPHDPRWISEDVARRKAQHSITRVLKAILPAIVADEVVSMRRSVVLDREVVAGVVKVGSSQKLAALVAKCWLDARPGKSSKDQQETQAGFHRALRRRLGEFEGAPNKNDAAGARVGIRPAADLANGHEAAVECRIQDRYRVDERASSHKIDHGPNPRGHRQTLPDRTIDSCAPADVDARATRHPTCGGDRRLYRFARVEIESMQPSGGWSRENGPVWKPMECSSEANHWLVGDRMPGVDAAIHSPPARAA
jgi:hypothetical protein